MRWCPAPDRGHERKAIGEDAPELARTLLNLGVQRREVGDLDEAETLHRRALAIRERDESPFGTASSLLALAVLARERGEQTAPIPPSPMRSAARM
jgi:hypothetical protein